MTSIWPKRYQVDAFHILAVLNVYPGVSSCDVFHIPIKLACMDSLAAQNLASSRSRLEEAMLYSLVQVRGAWMHMRNMTV